MKQEPIEIRTQQLSEYISNCMELIKELQIKYVEDLQNVINSLSHYKKEVEEIARLSCRESKEYRDALGDIIVCPVPADNKGYAG